MDRQPVLRDAVCILMLAIECFDLRWVSGKYFGIPQSQNPHIKVTVKLINVKTAAKAHAMRNFHETSKICQ